MIWSEVLREKIDSREARIGVMGLGYVGLPLVVEFARAGFRTTGFDLDEKKVRALDEHRSYIKDVSTADVETFAKQNRLRATMNFDLLAEMDIINVAVPTPLRQTKDPDFSFIVAAVEAIRKRLRSGQLIILGSTTYPGTTHDLYLPILSDAGLEVGKEIFVAFAPERIDPGNERFKIRNVPKVVGGETQTCTELSARVFQTIVDQVVPVSSSQCAEMVKLLENTFRAINIGLANEVALICNKLGLNVWEVIEAAATKPYGFMKFLPGPGLGGHCIPVDPAYLSWKMKALNFNTRFIELATEINTSMPAYVVSRIADLLNTQRRAINGAKILVLGVAYKRDIADMRESPALDAIELLLEKGADLSFFDPHVSEIVLREHSLKGLDRLEDAALQNADLVVVLTDHSSVDYARVAEKSKLIFDTRNALQNVVGIKKNVCKL